MDDAGLSGLGDHVVVAHLHLQYRCMQPAPESRVLLSLHGRGRLYNTDQNTLFFPLASSGAPNRIVVTYHAMWVDCFS
jgi:hypothetical protein